MKNFVKELEKKILNEFLEAFQLLEGKLKILKKIPFLTFQNQVSSWKILSKEKLIALSEKTEMNQINFDLLENKENPEKDIVRVGQTILAQTRKISCLSLSLIKTSIDNIEVRFNDQEIQKKIEEIFCERNLKLSPELTKNNLTNDDLKSIENYFNKIKALQESSIAFNNNNKWEFSLTNDEVFKSRQSISKINEKLEGRKTIMNQEEKPLQKSNISSDFHIANSFINSLNFQELIKESNPKLDDSEFLLSGDILDNSMKLTQNPLINNQTKSKPPLKQNYAEDKERTKQLQIIEEKSEKAIGSFKAIGNNRTYLLVNKRSISKSPFRGNNSNVNTSLDKMNENEFKNMISPSKNISPFLNDSLNDISTEKKLNTNTSQKKLSGYLGFRINEKFQPIFNGLRTDVLEVVDFTCADLGDAGIGFLAESLSNTVSMKSLKLVKNKITDEGGMILCKALAQNFSLANLNLTLNHLSEKSIDTFYGLIKGNATLKNLYLLQNNISVIKYKFKVKDFKLLGTNLFL